jgi:rsbT co-antagonist protein RsbR
MEISALKTILKNHENQVLTDWIREQLAAVAARRDLIKDSILTEQCRDFFRALHEGLSREGVDDLSRPEWAAMRNLLTTVSRTRGELGFSPSETATFVFSLKRPIFTRLRTIYEAEPAALAREIWATSELLDRLGLFTTEAYQKSREEVIARQQNEMLELSTPVVSLSDGILALPLIGTLDSNRTQSVTETLLQRIVETGAEVAIIDITGVPTVDTLVAQHLIKTVAATRLMGAECIISGIRPQIAQTIVHLAIDLGSITTKANLSDAFRVALSRTGRRIVVDTAARLSLGALEPVAARPN